MDDGGGHHSYMLELSRMEVVTIVSYLLELSTMKVVTIVTC